VSNLKESLKHKIKNRPGGSVHAQLIEEDVNVNDNVNVNVYRKKARKERFEERFVRHTHYIEKTLLEKLNSAAGDEKGEKTRIINAALSEYLKKGRE